ncbi:hypothetical protein MMC28_010269 [Mycoblastus sanguinarius]|nr:hypothetical protein [Mycoblastus sanguinarius]
MVGLCQPTYDSSSNTLYIPPVDLALRLSSLTKSPTDLLSAAGFLARELQYDKILITLAVLLVSGSKKRKITAFDEGIGKAVKWKRDPSPRSDARDLIKSYSDFVWAKDIRLERLAVDTLGTRTRRPDGRVRRREL